jgi:hypothetical protein
MAFASLQTVPPGWGYLRKSSASVPTDLVLARLLQVLHASQNQPEVLGQHGTSREVRIDRTSNCSPKGATCRRQEHQHGLRPPRALDRDLGRVISRRHRGTGGI